MKQPILYHHVTKRDFLYLLPRTLGIIIILVCLAYGSWKFERWSYYKFSYSSQVSEQVQPLVDRIVVLEKRMDALEKK